MISFVGQQDGERVLHSIKPHWIHEMMGYGQLGLSVLVLVIILGGIGVVTNLMLISVLGVLTGITVTVVGWWWVRVCDQATVTYITDRRVVRFSALVPWNVVSRSLTWDEVVKIKTFSTNPIWKMFNVGTVVIHARSTVAPTEEVIVTNDDVSIEHAEYYADLGHYLDKLLYYYKREPEQLKVMREFVLKPKGKRY